MEKCKHETKEGLGVERGVIKLAPNEIKKEYLEACEWVDIEIVKAEGLGRAVEILLYERDSLRQQLKEKTAL